MFKNVQLRCSTHLSSACCPHIKISIIALHGKITNNLACSFRVFVVHDVSLSYSSLPYEGVVQITIDSGTKNVCWQSLQQNHCAVSIICGHLGYDYGYFQFLVGRPIPTDDKNATFAGSINCNYGDRYLSQCSINASASESCSQLSYIHCKCGKMKRIECRGKTKE